MRQGAEFNRISVFSVRAGARFVCGTCKTARCSELPGDLGRQHSGLTLDEMNMRLIGLPIRHQAGRLTDDDRVFLLTQVMMDFWESRLAHQGGLRVTWRLWPPFACFAVCGTVAYVLVQQGQAAVVANVVAAALGLAALVFLVVWIRHLAGLDRCTVESELAPIVEAVRQFHARLEEIERAHRAVKACGFQFMNLASPRRIWRLTQLTPN
ncbi:MAG: hypothetical protein QM783_01315 [Phycisphaerales bacterium]